MALKSIQRQLRLILKGFVNCLLFKAVNQNKFASNEAIIICGAMRSGSTWLAEQLSAVNGHLQVFEPLHPQYVRDVKKAGLGQNRYFFIDKDKDYSKAKDFFNRILTGKSLNPWMLSQANLRDVLDANKLVIKFVRANLLINWMTEELNIRKPVVIIRHPCSIVASMMKKNWIKDKKQLLAHPYFNNFPEILKKCQTVETQEELSAVYWCIQYHQVLLNNNGRFIIVSYESLVKNGKEELIKIYAQWNESPPIEAIKRLQFASDTSTKDSMINQGKDPLAGWVHFLTEEQVLKILNVLSFFEICIYSKELEPDYSLIDQLNN